VRAVVRAELAKLVALQRIRLALLLVLVGPPVAALVPRLQTGLPTDTLYGRWVHDIGLAFPLVLLGSVGPWVIPVLASLVAGDTVAAEQAQGTWATLLTRSRSPWQVLGGKALVAGLATTVLVLALGASAVLAGLVLVGRQDLVGLTGQPVAFGHGLGLVVLAWVSTLPAALAVTAAALLVGATTRNGVLGVAVPPLTVAALGLAGLLAPLGGVRPFLLAPDLGAWHGLLVQGGELAPLLSSAAVALAYLAGLLGLTVVVLRARDWAAA
jgi:ABC-2 type transport system permease protein